MMQQLNKEQIKHSRNPEFMNEVLCNKFENESYDITFSVVSPNVIRGTFKSKLDGEVYESNFGLPSDSNGKKIRSENHSNIKPLTFVGFTKNSFVPYIPPYLEIETNEFIAFLNEGLISVQDNRGMTELNNPIIDDEIKTIDDIPF
ncbi:hypothetical protein [Mucilaginibacter defluvii]|uniref:Uncharacterized protein n=1 Tax=Mucilaginibacter defluvii TaxID=1196019 RepID=A0ABP9FP56_9SPHI